MNISKILLLMAFVGLLCSVSAHQFDFPKGDNTLMGVLPKVVGIGELDSDAVTISPDGESIQQAVDEIATKGTIYLTPGIYSKPGDYNVNIIGKDISIVALDDGVVVDAGKKGRLFNIDKNSKVNMEKLSLYNGLVDGDGAGINNAGELSIINCNISKNTAFIDDDSTGYAGAIYNTGNCKINNSFLSSNEARNCGGAIANFGTCAVANSEITNITSLSNGGVFYNTGNFTVSNTNIYKNTAYKNGGIIWNSGNFTSISTEFSKSVATKNSFDDPELLGGGVLYNKGDANIINSTLKNCSIRYNAVGNQVGGGAIVSDEGSTININGSTIDNHRNTAIVVLSGSRVNMGNSIFMNNDGSGGGAVNNNGLLNVVNSNFTNNKVDVHNLPDGGGAIRNNNNATIVASQFTNNSLVRHDYAINYNWGGGAITVTSDANINISDSNFTNNDFAVSVHDDAHADIKDSYFAKNSGRALTTNTYSKVSVVNSAFESNTASEYGGAISNNGVLFVDGCKFLNNLVTGSKYGGGAIANWNWVGNCTVINSIFTNNRAAGQGGAIYNDKNTPLVNRNNIFTPPVSKGVNDFYQA